MPTTVIEFDNVPLLFSKSGIEFELTDSVSVVVSYSDLDETQWHIESLDLQGCPVLKTGDDRTLYERLESGVLRKYSGDIAERVANFIADDRADRGPGRHGGYTWGN